MVKKYACVCMSLFIISVLFYSCGKYAPLPQSSAPVPPPANAQASKLIPLRDGTSPLTGLALTGSAKRPLAVMIDNVRVALPQRGIGAADIVYEMVTESGITRLMAMYSDYETMPEVGPVRSARDQHVQLMLPLNPLFLHVGASTYATDLLDKYHYSKYSINGYLQSGALRLDSERNASTSIEHCWFTDGALFTSAANACKLSLKPDVQYSVFDFADETRVLPDGDAKNVSLRFSSYVSSSFSYNDEKQKYYKSQFSAPQIDENTGEQLAFDNLIILFTDITKYPDGILANVDFRFGGVGYYFSKGRYENIRWLKGSETSPLLIVSADKSERNVKINPGTTYVAVVDLGKYEYFNISDKPIEYNNAQLPIMNGEDATESPD
ncbi:MAG: DUF3048 domain-containing protein [Oscillospiraceae bacterium]